MKKIELAYLAGFFDGEGCISLYTSHGRRYLTVSVSQTNRFILESFRFAFGGQVYEGQKHNGKRDIWRWTATTKIAAEFLKQIYPFLKLKKGEATIALEFQRNRYPRGKKLTEAEIAIIEAQKILLHNLKDKSHY